MSEPIDLGVWRCRYVNYIGSDTQNRDRWLVSLGRGRKGVIDFVVDSHNAFNTGDDYVISAQPAAKESA
jgi:hypothetical protein